MENMEIVEVNNNQVTVQNGLNAGLFQRWLIFLDVNPNSANTYKRAIRVFQKWLENKGIMNPTRTDIKAFKGELEQTHKATTTNLYLMALKQFFKWAESEGIYKNITVNIKGEKLDRAFKKDALTVEQVQKVLLTNDTQTPAGLRDFALLSLMVTTGLRTIEVERANVSDIRNVGNDTVLFIQGKGRTEKNDYVKLSTEVLNALQKYLKTRKDPINEKSPLFSVCSKGYKGNRLKTRAIRQIVKNHYLKAGLTTQRLTAHSLRHTTATLNLLNGGTLEETQQLLRHTNINTTLIYVHSLERINNNSENRISNAIFG